MNSKVTSLIVSVFFLSLVSIFGRLLFPISGFINTFFGYLVVLIITFLVILFKKNLNDTILKKKKKTVLFLALGQLGSAAFFLQAIQTIDIAIAGLLLYSAPIWIVIYYLITKEEKLGKEIIIPLILGIIGLILVFGPENIFNPSQIGIGLVFGLLSGISYSISFIAARKIKDEYKTATIVFWNHLIGVVVLLPLLFFLPFTLTPTTSLYFLGIGLSWTFGYFLLYYSLKFVKAQLASIIAIFEPVFFTLWGLMFFQEYISLLAWIGGGILLINIYLINRQINK